MSDLVSLVSDTQSQANSDINSFVDAVEQSKAQAVNTIENYTNTTDFDTLVTNIVEAYVGDVAVPDNSAQVAALDANTSAVESNTTATDVNTTSVNSNTEATTSNTNALSESTTATSDNTNSLSTNTQATTGNTNELAGLKAAVEANTAALKSGGSVSEGEFTGEVNYTDIGTTYIDGLSTNLTNLLGSDTNADGSATAPSFTNDFNIGTLATLGGSTSNYGQDANFAGSGGTCPFSAFTFNLIGGKVITVDTSFICMYSRPIVNLMMTIIILLTLVMGFRYVTR